MLGILGWWNFCLGGCRPLPAPPPPPPPVVAALLIRICPEHENICSRNRIFTVLQCLTILLSYAKWFVSIRLQSVELNLL